MHRNTLLAPQPYQTGSHHQLEVRERSKQHTFPLEHAQVHISDDSWYFTLYQPLAISWTSVQQGSYKCSHKKYSFHHAAMQRERTLLFTAVYQNLPKAQPHHHWPRRAMPGTAEVLVAAGGGNSRFIAGAAKQQFAISGAALTASSPGAPFITC